MDASSPIRTLVRASSVTSSSMLLATPRAHEAWPAAVIGMSPIRKAGGRAPLRGAGEQLEGPGLGDEDVGHVVVVASRSPSAPARASRR